MNGRNLSQFVISCQQQLNIILCHRLLYEQGVAMLSSILKSEKAIQANIAIMRAFVFIRQYALNHQDLAEKLAELEKRYNKKFQDIFEAINYLLRKDQEIDKHPSRKRIGFKQDGLDA